MVTTLGLVSGIIIHTSLVAFGVSAIIKESENLFLLIKSVGAVYLFYLAFRVWRSKAEVSFISEDMPLRQNASLFKQGLIMNVMNPKVTIFFLAFFPGFIWDRDGGLVYQFYTLGVIFMVQALLIFGLVAVLAGKISEYLKKHPNSGHVLKWVQVLVFIGIGIFILI